MTKQELRDKIAANILPQPNGCRTWAKGRTKKGYGIVCHSGSKQRVHRAVWELVHGRPIPEGHIIMHSCDYPSCVNPDHLFIGTHADNTADKMRKGRWGGPEKKLTPEQKRAIISFFDRIAWGTRTMWQELLGHILETNSREIRKALKGRRVNGHLTPWGVRIARRLRPGLTYAKIGTLFNVHGSTVHLALKKNDK